MEMKTVLPALVVASILLSDGINSVHVKADHEFNNQVTSNENQDPTKIYVDGRALIYNPGATSKEFVFVHGAAHGAWCWYKVATLLREVGYKCTTLDLSSAGTNDKLEADNVTSLAQLSLPLTDYLSNNVSGQVVLVGHSLGGMSISLAMEQYPTKISHAIFITAAMPGNNQSLLTSTQSSLLPSLQAAQLFSFNLGNGPTAPPTSLTVNNTAAPSFFYNLSPAMDTTLALTLLSNAPYNVIVEPIILTPARYGSVARYYLQTEVDNIWGPGGQEFIIANNPPNASYLIKGTDHSPFFSEPKRTARHLIRISYI